MRGLFIIASLLAAPAVCAQAATTQAANSAWTVSERLASAKEHVDGLEYIRALDELNDVISDARATEDELIEAHAYAGIVSRIVGNDVDARLHFGWVLKRRPQMRLPGSQPPKVAILYDMVRDELEGGQTGESAAGGASSDPTPSANTGPSVEPGAKTTGSDALSASNSAGEEPLPLILLSGGVIAVIGVVGLIVGAGTWGAGIAMFYVGNNDNVQVTSSQWSTPSVVAQVAGQVLAALGAVVLVGGAATATAGFFIE